jgi:hypothetical protein
VYKPPSTVPVYQHYPFSWIELVDAFMDEFDLERDEASRFRKNAFDRGRREPSMFRGEESDSRGKKSICFNSETPSRDPGRFRKEVFDCRSKDGTRGQLRDTQSMAAFQAQQRRCDRGHLHNEHTREGSALRYRSRERHSRSAGIEQTSERNTEQPTCTARPA